VQAAFGIFEFFIFPLSNIRALRFYLFVAALAASTFDSRLCNGWTKSLPSDRSSIRTARTFFAGFAR
jgi:hypothetical protein